MDVLISVQLNSTAEVDTNIDQVSQILDQGLADLKFNIQDNKLIVLPECFSIFGVSAAQMRKNAEQIGSGRIQEKLKALSLQYNAYIVAGTTPIVDSHDAEKYYAASLTYSPKGELISRYDKIHLFDVDVNDNTKSYRESNSTIPGKSLALFQTSFGEVAQSVCYDLRFASMFQAYAKFTIDGQSPPVIVVPSAFTKKTGEAHWHALLKARSIENQCYIVAANQSGKHADGRETFGHTCIYSPWGELLDIIRTDKGFALAKFDPSQITKVRKQMPLHQHKKERYHIEF